MRPEIDPPEAAELLAPLKHQGFGAWHLVDADQPSVIVLFRERGGWVDVVHVRGADRVEAARMPRDEASTSGDQPRSPGSISAACWPR